MEETLKLATKFSDEGLQIVFLLSLMSFLAMVTLWIYNRKKFNELAHHIPASVVKSYLDSIIENSNSLKSSLFRGGGLDVKDGVPSVLPLAGSGSGKNAIALADDGEMESLQAQIHALRSQVGEKNHVIRQLEDRLQSVSFAAGAEEEVLRLRSELSKKDAALQQALDSPREISESSGIPEEEHLGLKAERDSLHERLKEYEIIEEDLANLKRLQQENENLRAQLAGDFVPSAGPDKFPIDIDEDEEEAKDKSEARGEERPEAQEELAVEAEKAEEEIAEKAEEEIAAPAELELKAPNDKKDKINIKAEGPPPSDSEQRSAEELLSEFEKMLG